MLSTVYATDEDLLARAVGDFDVLVPRDQTLAEGTDGAIAAGSWDLTSAAVDFEARGVGPGNVVRAWGAGGSAAGTALGSSFDAGTWFAVADADGGTLTLRRYGLADAAGQPPSPGASLTGVRFRLPTAYPQIEDASYEINARFNIDPDLDDRTPADIYDVRKLRQATVLTALHKLYLSHARGQAAGNVFWEKAKQYRWELDEVLGRLVVHWGERGDAQPPTQRFGRVTR